MNDLMKRSKISRKRGDFDEMRIVQCNVCQANNKQHTIQHKVVRPSFG